MVKLNRNIIEKKLQVTAEQLLSRVQEVIDEGKAHEIVIKNSAGRIELKMPLIKGAAIGTISTICAPFLNPPA